MAVVEYGQSDAWQRYCLITVEDGTTAVTLHGITETVDIDQGERDMDVIYLCNLGQTVKHGGMGLTTITFEGYCKQSGTVAAGAATGYWDLFADKPKMDAADPMTNVITNTLTRYRISILRTNDGAATSGTSAVTSGNTYEGERYIMADCFCVSHKETSGDGILKATLMFKGPAFSKGASARIKKESVALATASALDAPASYVPGTTPW